jgi:glycosyltransferase involved in cell wall biosynthesis
VLAGGQGHDDEIDQAVSQVPPHLRLLRPAICASVISPASWVRSAWRPTLVRARASVYRCLEAMACGAPVLTTPRLSLPEVGGDAVAYTGPDPDDIARDLGALLDDEPRRFGLSPQAGAARAKEFSWDSSADVHLAAWARAVNG